MKRLRPYQILDFVDDENLMVTVCLPKRHSLTSMLERAILIALCKIIAPRTVFEFGTYLGETTTMLAANTNATVYSIDLKQVRGNDLDLKLDIYELKNTLRRSSEKLVFQGKSYENQIELLVGDSTEYDFSPYYHKMDFILIDGGHQIDVVKNDTQQSFKMLSRDHSACIVWHDYENPNYKITKYLDSLSRRHDLYHVEETKYVFYFNNLNMIFT